MQSLPHIPFSEPPLAGRERGRITVICGRFEEGIFYHHRTGSEVS